MRALSPRPRERWPLRRAAPTGGEPVYRGLAAFAGLVFRHGTREVWDDAAQLPATGGVLVVPNHVSYVDPIAVGRYLIWHGRWPRLLGKAELWRMPLIGWLARSSGQIPVERGSANARLALDAAVDALARGECVVIYPEGTRTRDPDLWPMAPRTGPPGWRSRRASPCCRWRTGAPTRSCRARGSPGRGRGVDWRW